MIGLGHYLAVGAILFVLGVFGIFLNRKNVIVILMAIELILLSVNINLVAFSAYLGALMPAPPNGIEGALIALLAIFLPSMLLVTGVLPFWWKLREAPLARAALAGVNAAVILDGRIPHVLLLELFTEHGAGTLITAG